jgi:hypothetical protein
MSRRGSKSADFIGGFKKFDYAIDISAEYHIVSGPNILTDFLAKLKMDRSNSSLKYEEMILQLNQTKSLLNLLKNSAYNQRIDEIAKTRRGRKTLKALKKNNSLKPLYDELLDDIIRTFSEKSKSIAKDSTVKSKHKFKPQIQFAEDGSLNLMNATALNNYITDIKKEYEGLYLKFIKKPSLNHLFEAAIKSADKPKRLRTIVILIQNDIKELEQTNYKVGLSKKGW